LHTDITISEELKQEGIARELVNRIQNIRKDSGFEVTDKLKVQLQRDGLLEEAILKNKTILSQKH
jgi:isoleucyl-tRNA synthetase